jgi:hypothetical protein
MVKGFIVRKVVALSFLSYCINIYAKPNKKNNELPQGWVEIKPGGLSKCARGEEFSFFYRPGQSKKIVIDFIGGGACWNANTCSKKTATFVDSVDYIRKRAQQGLNGIYNHQNPDNPIKDWNHLIIPYCTGDVHWGENDTTYTDDQGQKFIIHHRGATNTKAALNWLTQEIHHQEKILITGCSAGSYGSIYWTPTITEIFPHAKIYQLGDSGTGIVTESFLNTSHEKWNIDHNAPFWIPDLNPNHNSWKKINLDHIYKSIGKYYPEIKLSQFSFTQDDVQKFFYELMRGDTKVWSEHLQQSFYNIENNLENFIFYREKGTQHCTIPYPNFYEKNSQKTSKSDWLKKFINDQEVESIDCPNC